MTRAHRRPAGAPAPGLRLAIALCAAIVGLVVALPTALASPQPLPTGSPAPVRPSAGCARSTLETGDRRDGRVDVDGVARTYVLDAPPSLRPGVPVPLLLDFHGIGHSGGGVWRVSGFRDIARREPFVTAYPDGLPVRLETPERVFEGPGWEVRTVAGNRDVAFAARLLDRLEAEYCIDLSRVYATGFSNGAYLSQLLGCTLADRIAAIAPVSGGKLPVACAPSRPVPILIHHGRLDDVIPVAQARRARDEWARRNGCAGAATPAAETSAGTAGRAAIGGAGASADGPGGSGGGDGIACAIASGCRGGAVVEYCEGDFAHRWPPAATARVWDFLLAHPLATAP